MAKPFLCQEVSSRAAACALGPGSPPGMRAEPAMCELRLQKSRGRSPHCALHSGFQVSLSPLCTAWQFPGSPSPCTRETVSRGRWYTQHQRESSSLARGGKEALAPVTALIPEGSPPFSGCPAGPAFCGPDGNKGGQGPRSSLNAGAWPSTGPGCTARGRALSSHQEPGFHPWRFPGEDEGRNVPESQPHGVQASLFL